MIYNKKIVIIFITIFLIIILNIKVDKIFIVVENELNIISSGEILAKIPKGAMVSVSECIDNKSEIQPVIIIGERKGVPDSRGFIVKRVRKPLWQGLSIPNCG